jgi:hypothetical protein
MYVVIYTECPGRKGHSILGGNIIGHSKQKLHMCVCPIPNGFRNRAISRYNSLDGLKRATRHILTRVAKCIVVGSGILKNVSYCCKL